MFHPYQWAQPCGGIRNPHKQYIVAIEKICTKLQTREVEEWRVDMSGILRCSRSPKANMSKSEWWALQELRSDSNRIILLGEGSAMVAMDEEDYLDNI